MVSKNDPAYKYVKQADAKEAPRKRRLEAARRRVFELRAKREEFLRTRSSRTVLKNASRIPLICLIHLGVQTWHDGWQLFSFVYPFTALCALAYHYPEWSRKRKAEKSG